MPRASAAATASAPKLTKRSLRPVEHEFEAALGAYVKSIRLLRSAAAMLVEKPTSTRRLDAVLRARMREVEARREYQKASKRLFETILTDS